MDPVVHFELPAKDSKRIKTFYTKAFGWKANELGAEMGHYIVVHTGETDKAGMMKKPGMINGGIYTVTPEMPPQHPSVVISVKDIKAAVKTIKAVGGTVLGEPMIIPGVGTYAPFMDPEGNRLSVLQPLPMKK